MIAVFEASQRKSLILRRAFMHFFSSNISRRISVAPFVFVVAFAAANSALAQKETVLYSFGIKAAEGATPWGSLIMDKAGDLYGTTSEGGAYGLGTVFKLSPPATKRGAWTGTVLYSFGSQPGDGATPYDSLVTDKDGNLYGTTYSGGANNVGTVFELSPEKTGTWTETVLYNFGGAPNDGSLPYAGLMIDTKDNLYGTTYTGGANNAGTVFKLTREKSGAWSEAVLHGFGGAANDGSLPYAGLIMDKAGDLYGTTSEGGAYSFGTVFKLSREKGGVWTETGLYSFGSQSEDGVNPHGSLIMDKAGNLYGMTTGGGKYVYGEVFKLSPPAEKTGIRAETILYSFGSYSIDGAYPFDGLIMDETGNLYGTTTGGGKYSFGTVFQMSPPAAEGSAWTEEVLYSFGGTRVRAPNGEEPWDSLIMDNEGNLYGTTTEGGATTHCDYGCGTVFKLAPKKDGT
jgi:uncharacterized repeat protein (TIGR03803 family)